MTYEGIRSLQGIGDYTAAAVASFAYGLPHAVVDGNVYRVLSRIYGIDTPIDTTEGRKLFAALADELLDRKDPGGYNQALMEFGALYCVPRSPQCGRCIFADRCMALATHRVEELPVKQWALNAAQQHVLVVDHSKFGKVRPARMGELSRFDAIVSDCRPDDELVAYAKAQQVKLMY